MKKEELQKQISLYSLDTKDFYHEKEKIISDLILETQLKVKDNNIIISKNRRELKKEENSELAKQNEDLQEENKTLEKDIVQFKKQLKEEIEKDDCTQIRHLNPEGLKTHKVVALFESSLTRICKIPSGKLTEKLFIIRAYHYKVLESIIKNGFMYNNEHYQYFTSSAGQIRTKKIVCINSKVFRNYENSITCGLTKEMINEKNGVNINKYQAYLALINSASAKWRGFNIDKTVVVDDMCTDVFAEVDSIDEKTYEIERKHMNLPIEHMDGCGIMLPSVSDKTFMFRMPWVKGMLVPFDFKKFASENKQTKIKDIYGKEYDVIDDEIEIIITKSQFKMWKYYESWESYKENFKKYKSESTKLNVEDVTTEAKINYQMLQTLVSMTEDELTTIAQSTIDLIHEVGTSKNKMLELLGATKTNKNKSPLQESLLLYPELLSDNHAREIVKNNRKKLIKDAKAGKLKVNGYYTFLIPDLYAFCEWLFLGEMHPQGLLKNKEVYCNIFNEGKVDVLRAPHLYKEHAIRNNTVDDKKEKWFITKGIYTSVHDPISRILQFDNDGDKALVLQDDVLISVAEREMQGIVPLYYEMAKAEAQTINSENMYNALTSAYKANIGIISNDITKIWNSSRAGTQEAIDAVKWLTMYNNFIIDFAKTLYKPEHPTEKAETIKSFTKNKLPFFFQYAKDKEYVKSDKIELKYSIKTLIEQKTSIIMHKNTLEGSYKYYDYRNKKSQVEECNNSTVNKLDSIIPSGSIQFKRLVGAVDCQILMKRRIDKLPSDISSITDIYDKMAKSKRYLIGSHQDKKNASHYFNEVFKEEMKKSKKKIDLIVDVLIYYLYSEKKTISKDTLWNAYGDIIVENIKANLKNTKACEICLDRFSSKQGNERYCKLCKEKVKKEQVRVAVSRHRAKCNKSS